MKRALPYVGTYVANRFAGGSKTGSNYQHSNTDTYAVTKRRKKYVARSFKSKVMAAQSAFHEVNNSTAAMTFGFMYSSSPTFGIPQGTDLSSRQGDTIFLEAIKVEGHYETDPAAGAYQCRILVGFIDVDVSNAGGTMASTVSLVDVFLVNSYATSPCDGIVNPKNFTCLWDYRVENNSQIADARDVRIFRETIPIKKSFTYKTGTLFGKDKNLVVLACSDVANGTVGSTSSGFVSISTDLIFKQ